MKLLPWLDDKWHGLVAWWSNPFRRYWPSRPEPKRDPVRRRTP